jgi:hypothetical protein
MTAEEWLAAVQSDVRRQAEDEARLMALGKWPDGMPHSGQSCDLSGVADVLDRQTMVAEEVARARTMCHALDAENPRHRWGRILECYYVDDLSIKTTAEVVGYAEITVKHEKATALDVMTDRFFSPRKDYK